MYSKFSTVVHHMEMLRVALDYYKKEDQESTNRVLELEKDSIRWTYAGFYPEASGWYYTKDLNGIVMDRHFDTVKGWTPNDSFDTWAHIPEIHVL